MIYVDLHVPRGNWRWGIRRHPAPHPARFYVHLGPVEFALERGPKK